MDASRKKGILVGYCEVSKSLRIYILGFHRIDISRDITFDEETALKKYKRHQLEQVHEEYVPPRRTKDEPTYERIALEYHDMIEPQEPPTMDISRERKPLGKRNHTRSINIWSTKRLHKNQQKIKAIF